MVERGPLKMVNEKEKSDKMIIIARRVGAKLNYCCERERERERSAPPVKRN